MAYQKPGGRPWISGPIQAPPSSLPQQGYANPIAHPPISWSRPPSQQQAYPHQPYTQQQPQHPPGYAQQAVGQPPPHQFHQPSSHTLHLQRDGMLSKNTTILDAGRGFPLYTVEVHTYSKPNVVISSAATSAPTGNITYHSMSSKIDVQVQNCSFKLESLGVFSSGYSYRSPGFNTTLSWKREGWLNGGNMTCTDERGMVLARFETSSWSMSKAGMIEIMGQALAQSPMAVEELVVTGMAMVEMLKKRQRSAASSGLSAG